MTTEAKGSYAKFPELSASIFIIPRISCCKHGRSPKREGIPLRTPMKTRTKSGTRRVVRGQQPVGTWPKIGPLTRSDTRRKTGPTTQAGRKTHTGTSVGTNAGSEPSAETPRSGGQSRGRRHTPCSSLVSVARRRRRQLKSGQLGKSRRRPRRFTLRERRSRGRRARRGRGMGGRRRAS